MPRVPFNALKVLLEFFYTITKRSAMSCENFKITKMLENVKGKENSFVSFRRSQYKILDRVV